MRILGIDSQVCTRCGECVAECPASLFVGDADTVPVFDEGRGRCIRCGHCVAVCPADAVVWEDGGSGSADETTGTPALDNLQALLASRRSVRRYRGEPVPTDQIKAILDAVRQAPSASNRRHWEFLVITDPATRRRLAGETIRVFRLVRRLLAVGRFLPFLLPGALRERAGDRRTFESIDRIVNDWRNGGDRILFGAPCVIVLHLPDYGHMSALDAGVAVTHAMLAAHARGFGTCWIGFVIELLLHRPRLARRLGIPRGRKAWGVFTLGYPAPRYHRAPPRSAVPVTGLGPGPAGETS